MPVLPLLIALVIGSISPVAVANEPPDASASSASATTAAPGPPVVPRPTRWTESGGHTQLSTRTRILVDPRSRSRTALPAGRAELPGPARQSVQDLARQVRTEVAQVSGVTSTVSSDVRHARAGDIVLTLTEHGALGAEGYRFDSTDAVRIEAASTHGLFYGTRTLLQLLRAAPDHLTVPKARSTDRPAQPVRMTMLDAGRKYWQPEYLEKLVRRMADQKLNTLFLQFGRTTLYANGARVGTVDASIALPLRSIGTEKAGLRGALDEITTWDEALSPEQVRADYAHHDR
ncbi:glycoside hydrolase family 20 zincin-like fold domain-containing protein [Streptomyces sp. NBC_01800]|uniref:glycoside hydrolase family 20 zincin-like fold domain-containing protein n=1 Tax=Streptomyces sp. NBC_01800 TaxID=2975945 RepID=UPI002DD9F3D4|nr:glycoside hydrolase family 20 zincin-like fold domain-containing protein [Streptomyces sp. NBC_01800]WSA73724.1 beta-N-acetylhexosaminidase [Streptomyces sp. NBC_01800]